MEQKEARDRILDAALKIFSEKGFDGARIDAVAAQAGVNKALIYYYFKGKKELLNTLLSDFLKVCESVVMRFIREFDFQNMENTEEVFDKIFHFLQEHESLLRLILLETLKRNNEQPFLFDFLSLYLGGDQEDYRLLTGEIGLPEQADLDLDQIRVMEFFTLLGPVILFILLKEDWMEYFEMEKPRLTALFVKALKQTHIHHHIE